MCVCGLCVCVCVCVGGGRKLGWKRKICHSLVFIKRVEAVQLCLVVAEENKFDDKENVQQQRKCSTTKKCLTTKKCSTTKKMFVNKEMFDNLQIFCGLPSRPHFSCLLARLRSLSGKKRQKWENKRKLVHGNFCNYTAAPRLWWANAICTGVISELRAKTGATSPSAVAR